MSQENPILEYASPPPAEKMTFPPFVRLIVFLFILPALAMPFVPYTSQYPPMHTATEFFRNLMSRSTFWAHLRSMWELHFFMGIPLVLCHLRILIFGELSRIERWLGYFVAGLGMTLIASTAWLFEYGGFRPLRAPLYWTMDNVLFMAVEHLPAIVFFFGVFIIGFLGKRISHGTRICACLCLPYAVNLLFCATSMWLVYTSSGLNFVSLRSANAYLNRFNGYVLSFPVMMGTLIEFTTLAVMAFQRGGRRGGERNCLAASR